MEGGYVGKIARVNLSKRSVKVEPVKEEFMVRYVGGRGWGARILYDELNKKIDPFSPENKIIVSAGPLCGLSVQTAGKMNFSSISPATGLYGDSNMGGRFAAHFKKSGLDALIIEGKSEEQVYLVVEDGNVSFKDAFAYWGMFTMDAEKTIAKDEGIPEEGRVAVIGPAGENLVNFACIHSDFGRQAGRCGIGAVMGRKRLKAIVAKGDEEVAVADHDGLMEIFKEAGQHLASHKDFGLWQKQGTMSVIDWSNGMSSLPTRNFSEAQYEGFEKIDGNAMEKFRIKNKGCYLCPIRCGQVTEVGVIRAEGPEYETAAMIGSNCALPSIEDVIEANYWCDQCGLDTISAGNVTAFAMECFERGIITRDQMNGLELKFGNTEALLEFLKIITYRKGLADLFGQGVRAASTELGKGSERFAMHVKGLEMSGYDSRAAPAMGLSYATADIGAHHNRAWAITSDIEFGRDVYGEDFSEPKDVKKLAATVRNKVEIVIRLQHIRPMFDNLGICRFPWVEFDLPLDCYPRIYKAATGLSVGLEDLLKKSEIIWNMTRLINIRQGLTARDDWLPERLFSDPIPAGPYKGYALDKEKFWQMLQKYYRLRGWDTEGVPTREKLRGLGLSDHFFRPK